MTTAALPYAPMPWPRRLAAGFHASWKTVLLIAAINTAIAAAAWIDDPRPWWHPVISAQCMGFAVAWCVNVVKPWEYDHGLRRLVPAVAVGVLLGTLLIILVKQYSLAYVVDNPKLFGLTILGGFGNGLLISLIFHTRFRDTRVVAALGRAETERVRLQKHAVEAELMLMQAQVEPHFLFNTLASVQFLTETDPAGASRLLGHLISYLRAALPQLRAGSSTVGKEMELAREYLSILRMRMGDRLAFSADAPDALRHHPFPPNMVISLVENAIRHGVEPAAGGGTVTVVARQDGNSLEVLVSDTGKGLDDRAGSPGSGVGLTNIRERLAALYGSAGHFSLDAMTPQGTRATIRIPLES